MFKRTLSLALAALFVLSFVACGEKTEVIPTESAQKTTAPAEITPVVKVNKIKGISDVMPKYSDPETTFTLNMNIKEISGYFGKNLAALNLKNTPADGFVYDGHNNFKIIYNKNGMNIIADHCYFDYTENDKSFTITASRLNTPINFVYTFETEDKTDFKLTNGATMQIAVGFKSKDEQPKFDYDLYAAEFEQDGIYYKIEGKNVSDKEFYCIISSILNAKEVESAVLPESKSNTKLTAPNSAVYYSGGQRKNLSADKAKKITDKLNYYLVNGKSDIPSLWVIEEIADKVKDEQKCVELIYSTEQKSQKLPNSVWNFNKLLIILDGERKGMIMHAENGAYTGSAITIFNESFTKDILNIIK